MYNFKVSIRLYGCCHHLSRCLPLQLFRVFGTQSESRQMKGLAQISSLLSTLLIIRQDPSLTQLRFRGLENVTKAAKSTKANVGKIISFRSGVGASKESFHKDVDTCVQLVLLVPTRQLWFINDLLNFLSQLLFRTLTFFLFLLSSFFSFFSFFS